MQAKKNEAKPKPDIYNMAIIESVHGSIQSNERDIENINADEKEDEINYEIIQEEYEKSKFALSYHLRKCQIYEFEALYSTIGCYLLGGFLPVIPGPCGLYRASVVCENSVRNWYFNIINKINKGDDAEKFDLIIGNLQLAEDRILTISSILMSKANLHHALVPECVFYFDPITDLNTLMKQRKRWINGSAASVIFVLRCGYLFKNWGKHIHWYRLLYVKSVWYVQLMFFILNMMNPPILFKIAFEFSLISILTAMNFESLNEGGIQSISNVMVVICWVIYLAFIYTCHNPKKNDKIIKFTLYFSFSIGFLTLAATLIQLIEFIGAVGILNGDQFTITYQFLVLYIGVTFFVLPFILAPIFSRDWQTVRNLLSSCVYYYIYAIFYFTFFFIYAVSNVHDLRWGTRPDATKETGSVEVKPVSATRKLLLILIIINIIIFFIPILENQYTLLIFVFPPMYQIFFSIIFILIRDTKAFAEWLVKLKPIRADVIIPDDERNDILLHGNSNGYNSFAIDDDLKTDTNPSNNGNNSILHTSNNTNNNFIGDIDMDEPTSISTLQRELKKTGAISNMNPTNFNDNNNNNNYPNKNGDKMKINMKVSQKLIRHKKKSSKGSENPIETSIDVDNMSDNRSTIEQGNSLWDNYNK